MIQACCPQMTQIYGLLRAALTNNGPEMGQKSVDRVRRIVSGCPMAGG
jgi:hypothetical protein